MRTMIQTIQAGNYGIVVELGDDGGGSITSNLHESIDTCDSEEALGIAKWNSAMDGIEAMVLAHACSGVRIDSSEYREGLETALDSLSNHAEELGN